MTPDQILQFAQIGVSFLAFGGIVFAMGRIAERVTGLHKGQEEIKAALFGGEDRDGVFLRRAEAKLMLENSSREHEAFDRRLSDQSREIGALRERLGS